jgi:hypothetical protein
MIECIDTWQVITTSGKRCFFSFVEHPKLVKGKFTASFTLKDSAKLWDEVADILNAIPGPSKSGKDWKEVCTLTHSLYFARYLALLLYLLSGCS